MLVLRPADHSTVPPTSVLSPIASYVTNIRFSSPSPSSAGSQRSSNVLPFSSSTFALRLPESLQALSPPTLWGFISESLEKFHEPARKTIAFVRSANLKDEQRCGVWLRLCLNEGCLHKMLQTLCNDMPAQQLRAWYGRNAFIFSDHMTVLLSLCAGLDDVNFQLPLHLPPEPPSRAAAAAAAPWPESSARCRSAAAAAASAWLGSELGLGLGFGLGLEG